MKKFQVLAAAVGGVSIAVIVFAVGRGNQQIAAFSVGLWFLLCFWPVKSKCAINQVGTRRGVWVFGTVSLMLAAGASVLIWRSVVSVPGVDREAIRNSLDAADALVSDGRGIEALRMLEAIEVPEDLPLENARKHHNCGVILIQLSRPREALIRLMTSLKYDPTNAEGAYLAARICADQGQLDAAWRMVEVALLIDPQLVKAKQLQDSLRRQMELR